MTVKIIERPTTHELLADDGFMSLYDFNGTPYSRPRSLSGWKLVAEAPSVAEWIKNPGNYRTYYGAFTASVIYPDGKREICKLGDNITWLNGWIADMRRLANVSIQWIAAYSDRNVARAQTEPALRIPDLNA